MFDKIHYAKDGIDNKELLLMGKMTKRTNDKFVRYRRTINSNCNYGLMHLKIVGYLNKYFKENPNEYRNLCTLFFRTTEDAHFDVFLSYIFRIFDKNRRALSIFKFLDFIEDNLDILFTNKKDLVKRKIVTDKKLLNSRRDLLDKLRTIRNKAHFHQDLEYAGNYLQVYRLNFVPVEKLENLIKLVIKIVDHYSFLFDGRRITFEIEKYIEQDINDLFELIYRGKRTFDKDAKN